MMEECLDDPIYSENMEIKTEANGEDIKKVGKKKKFDIQCSHCDKTFSSACYLKSHIKIIHDKIKEHMCDICCKTFATTQNLTHHQKVHNGEKLFPCHICGKSYQTKEYLSIHTRIHTGEKPYFCEQCGKSFSDPSSFKAHKKQHTDLNTSFPCSICGKVLKREKNLRLHMAIHAEGRPYTEGEKIVFTNEFKVEALKKVKEIGAKKTSNLMNVPYTTLRNWVNVCKGDHHCQFCGRIFPFKASLEKHVKQKHSKTDEEKKLNLPNVRYDAAFKAEVAEFAESHTRQEAMEKYSLGESTIRRWIQVTKDPIVCTICGRTCAYQKELDRHMVEVHKAQDIQHPSANKPQASLKEFMETEGEEITFDRRVGSTHPDPGGLALQSPAQIAFLDRVIKEYGGGQLARGLDKIKTIPEDKLDEMIMDGSYRELFQEEPKAEETEEEVVEEVMEQAVGEGLEEDFKPTSAELLEFKLDVSEDNKFDDDKVGVTESNDDEKDNSEDSVDREENTASDNDDQLNIHDDNMGDSEGDNDDYAMNKDEAESTEVKAESVSFDAKQELVKLEPEQEQEADEFPSTIDVKMIPPKEKKTQKHLSPSQRPVRCKECGKLCNKRGDLKRHMLTHNGAKNCICTVCAKPFSLQQNLERHMRVHDGLRPFLCQFCNKSFTQSSSMKEHEGRVHTGALPHKCKDCEAKFVSATALIRHKVEEHGAEKPLKCDVCSKGFVRNINLVEHRRTHTGERPFECEVCGHCFSSRSGMKTHKTKHDIENGIVSPEKVKKKLEKRVNCELCGKGFVYACQYERHMKGHSGIKDHQCTECGKSYSSKRSMEQHVEIVHQGKKTFECKVCCQMFGRLSSLRVHDLSHTKELPFKCDFCSAGYKEKRNLLKHVAKVHQGVKPDETCSESLDVSPGVCGSIIVPYV